MDAGALHRRLTAPDASGALPAFERHVAACILAVAAAEAAGGATGWAAAAGLDPQRLYRVLDMLAPAEAAGLIALAPVGPERLLRDPVEAALAGLLAQVIAPGHPLAFVLPDMVAARAMRPNHLWQDLGLADRSELSRLMTRAFPYLAARNRTDMKWKKFLHRQLCVAGEGALCAAPSCSACDDIEACFGDEAGESFLAPAPAAAARGVPLTAAHPMP
jgi:nitrogen fixation protein NifQ